MPKVLPHADFILVAVPLTKETINIIGRKELNLLPTRAGLINMSRSATVDYEALAEKLVCGELGGAILDVFETEPLPSDSPLWWTPNLIITPHVSSDDSENYIPLTLDLAFENIRRYLNGKPLKNRVRLTREF
jgi:phosphoglycerate dehydrogenase-like enzyme